VGRQSRFLTEAGPLKLRSSMRYATFIHLFDHSALTSSYLVQCEACPYGALDLTPSLFSYLSGDGIGPGVLYGTWSFGSGSPPSTTSSPPPPPTTSHTSTTHKVTTTSHTSTTSSTWSTTEQSSSSSLSSSSSTSAAPSTSSSSQVTPTTSVTTSASPTSTDSALAEMNQAFLQIANYLVAAAAVDATNE
jgi:hypothetical protein